MALRPASQTRVVVEQPGGALCPVIEVVLALMLEGVPPEPGATEEQVGEVRRVNAQLAQRRETIMGLPMLREMGCG